MGFKPRKYSAETDVLMDEHEQLMNGYTNPLPHTGWVLCRCPLARKLREIHDIPEPESGGTRIRLDQADLGQLLRGEIVCKTSNGERVLLALADIGFDVIHREVALAELAVAKRR